MCTLLVHITVHPGKASAFEEIIADMVAHTRALEPDCLRYEYWRGATENHYYCLLSFTSRDAFYAHQNSPYHDRHMEAFAACFADLKLEYVDPLPGDAGGGLPMTLAPPVPADAPARMHEAEQLYPVSIAPWWSVLRTR